MYMYVLDHTSLCTCIYNIYLHTVYAYIRIYVYITMKRGFAHKTSAQQSKMTRYSGVLSQAASRKYAHTYVCSVHYSILYTLTHELSNGISVLQFQEVSLALLTHLADLSSREQETLTLVQQTATDKISARSVVVRTSFS